MSDKNFGKTNIKIVISTLWGDQHTWLVGSLVIQG